MLFHQRFQSRSFLDTSVILAAALSSRGASRALLNLISAGGCSGFVSAYVLEEVRRNVGRKAPHMEGMIDTIVTQAGLKIVVPTSQQIAQVQVNVELKDAPVVAAALATLDKKHLLSQQDAIRTTFGLLVVDPGAIVRRAFDR